MATGADALCQSLEACGVECVFGLPGTQSVPLYEGLRRSRIRSVLATHELSASFMANGYHRASGRLAALFTIQGPGFTYALAGLAEARHDSAALVYLVGRGDSARPFSFQALDQRSMAVSVVKGILSVERVGEIPARIREACDLALGGEPGPVMVEWSAGALTAPAPAEGPGTPPARRAPPPSRAAVEAACGFLAAARRPLLVVGLGAAGAARAVLRLAEALGAPVVTSTSGRGVVPEDHPLSVGFDSARCDTGVLNELVADSDAVLVLGCKLTAAGTADFALRLPEASLVRVDASPEVLESGYTARYPVHGAVEDVVEDLVAAAGRRARGGWDRAEIAGWRRRLRGSGPVEPEPRLHGVSPPSAEAFFGALRRALPRDGILVLDSGLHQTLARRHFEVLSPRGLLLPSDFQSMGFALPAAIGARLAAPERPAVALLGDGGLRMSGMEILTAVRERLALTVVVFNDGYLNRIRLQQLARYGSEMSVDIPGADLETFAAAVGAEYAALENGDAAETLARAIGSGGVTLVEVRVGDSPAVRWAGAKGKVRAAARRALGPTALERLKRVLRRGRMARR